ncbi:MAG: metallophosphoesterase family protein [Spirochaetales bacterium]
MRIAVLSDLHANLPVAEAAIRQAKDDGCDRIVHLGDAINYGGWPAETLDLLRNESVECVRGNHDEYPIYGIPEQTRRALSPQRLRQYERTAAALQERHIDQLLSTPLSIESLIDEWLVRFVHYFVEDGRVSEVPVPSTEDELVKRFAVRPGEILCFGHSHRKLWSFRGDRAILNPGATGFDDQAVFAVLNVRDIGVWVEWHQVDVPQIVATEIESEVPVVKAPIEPVVPVR